MQKEVSVGRVGGRGAHNRYHKYVNTSHKLSFVSQSDHHCLKNPPSKFHACVKLYVLIHFFSNFFFYKSQDAYAHFTLSLCNFLCIVSFIRAPRALKHEHLTPCPSDTHIVNMKKYLGALVSSDVEVLSESASEE